MLKFFFEKQFDKRKGEYPFFKKCPRKYWPYFINKQASYVLGYNFDYTTPRTLNEKIRYLINNEKLEQKTKLTDKILAKGYIAKKIGANHCAPLYGVYDNFDDIDFSILPDEFVLKANHGWKMNVVVNSQEFIKKHKKTLKELTDEWLKIDFEYYSCEPQYRNIKKKLLIEYKRQIKRNENYRCDYKVHCLNGKIAFIEKPFTSGDFKNYKCYSTDYKLLPFNCSDVPPVNSDQEECPAFWEEMIEYAQILSKDFSYVRIDFAPDNKDLHVVELTFTPFACKMPFTDVYYDQKYGEMLEIPIGV